MSVHVAAPSLTVSGRTFLLSPRSLRDAAVAEVLAMPRGLRLWLGFLGALLALATVAALIALPPGWEVLGTTPSFEWGLLIVGYVFFAIMTSGLCLASSLGTVFGIERFKPLERRHAILAVLSLTAAFGIIALDLHYPVRMVFGAVFVPSPTSPMWWMGVFYGMYLCFLLVEVWSMFFGHPTIHQAACVASSCMAIIAPSTLGAVFGVLAARPFWYGAFTPVQMVASALLAGTCLLGVVFYAVWRLRLVGWERAGELAIPAVRLLITLALVAVSLLLARHVVTGLMSTQATMRGATLALVAGPLAPQFWILRVALGLVVPIVLVALPLTRTPRGTFVAAVLALAGVFVDRLTFVSGGQVSPISTSAGTVSAPYVAYSPSPVEIAIVVGAAAFVAFAYTLAERYLDLGEPSDHADLRLPWAGWLRLEPRRWLAGLAGVVGRGGRPRPAEEPESEAEPAPEPEPTREPETLPGVPIQALP